MWRIKISGIAARHKKITQETGLIVYQLVGSVETEDGKCCDRPSVGLVTVKDFSYIRNFKCVFSQRICQ